METNGHALGSKARESSSVYHESDFEDEESQSDTDEDDDSKYDDGDKVKTKKQPSEAEKKIDEQKTSLRWALNAIATILSRAQKLSSESHPDFPTGNTRSDMRTLMVAHNSKHGPWARGRNGVLVDLPNLVQSLVNLDLTTGSVIEAFERVEKERREKATDRARLATARHEAYYIVAQQYIEDMEDFEAAVDQELSDRDPPAGSRAQVQRSIRYHLAKVAIDDLESKERTAALRDIKEKTREILSMAKMKREDRRDATERLEDQRFENAYLHAKMRRKS
ncbi:hypothetical protein DL98DRAFT_621511 [Cadophora sp. DSE1049]|nr:hypothetical protein DL98DRAFT_621511 [Cadophora sp. DSE1049]